MSGAKAWLLSACSNVFFFLFSISLFVCLFLGIFLHDYPFPTTRMTLGSCGFMIYFFLGYWREVIS